MQHISIHEAGLDSVLAAPLCDGEGRILLDAGVRLTPSLVRRLERWCIPQVTVAQSPDETLGALEDDHDLIECWDRQFASYEDRSEMKTIHRALVQWESTRRGSNRK